MEVRHMNRLLSPALHSSPVIRRYPGNPILTAQDVPFEATLVFNAGVTKFQGKYVMIFRNDYGYEQGSRFKGTNLGIAFSGDGIHWEVRRRPFLTREDIRDEEITRIYDPRLTVLDGRCYLCFAVDTRHGVRGGIGVTEDFEKLDILSMSLPDDRNMVLFPEKIGGKYVRLERPMPVYSRGGDRFDTWISQSPDLRYWGDSSLLLAVEQVPFANDKVGPGAPPIRTEKGWLALFHAVDIDRGRGKNGWEDRWQKRYCAGVMLLDADDPSRVIGLSREPLIAPEADYETVEGFRQHVIFPGGMIREPDGEVKIYYGASDTVECMATTSVDELLALCRPL